MTKIVAIICKCREGWGVCQRRAIRC